MVVVAQLVRAMDCGSIGRGFESRLPPECTLNKCFPLRFVLGNHVVTSVTRDFFCLYPYCAIFLYTNNHFLIYIKSSGTHSEFFSAEALMSLLGFTPYSNWSLESDAIYIVCKVYLA